MGRCVDGGSIAPAAPESEYGWRPTCGWALGVMLAAFWPVWFWYAARFGDGSDEPLGCLALLAVFYFLPWKNITREMGAASLALCCLFLAVYISSFGFLPPLARAILALACISPVLFRMGAPWTIHALMLLSLPLIATMQFYLGFPARWATSVLAAESLSLMGWKVVAEGTLLVWAGERVAIDSPCSGVKMLWAGSFVTNVAMAYFGTSIREGWKVLMFGSACLFTANLLRCVLLFFKESGMVPAPEWAHGGVGMVCFVGAMLPVIVMIRRVS